MGADGRCLQLKLRCLCEDAPNAPAGEVLVARALLQVFMDCIGDAPILRECDPQLTGAKHDPIER